MSTPRFVVFSDTHLRQWQYGAKLVDGYNSRLLHQRVVLQQIADYCLNNRIEQVFFCGDLFHDHSVVQAEVLTVAYHSFMEFKVRGIEMTFLVGNHDQANKEGDIHLMKLLNHFGEVVDRPVHRTWWSAMPYTEDEDSLYEFLNEVPSGHIVFLHQGVSGVEVSSKGFTLNEILKPDKVPPHIRHIFTGHYHSYRRVNDQITIPGSPYQMTWADTREERGWLSVELLDDMPIHIHHQESHAPKFIELDMSGGPFLSSMGLEGNFVRAINVPADKVKETREALVAAKCESVEIQVKPEYDAPIQAVSVSSLEELFDEFVKAKQLDEKVANVGRRIINA